MRRIGWLGLAMVLAVIVSGCGPRAYLKEGKLKDVLEPEQITERVIEAIGIGAADQTLESQTQRRATSRQAAIVAAQYELATMIKGVRIEGGITVEKAMQTDSVIAATVDTEIKGAQITRTEWTKDDGCVVTLRLDLKGFAKRVGVKLSPQGK